MTIEDFYTKAAASVGVFDAFATKHSLIGTAQADHICYKCGSQESFEAMRAMLEPESEYLHQATISGRRIAYLKLKRPVQTVLGSAYFVELSDQKPDGSQQEGFDHVEVYPLAMSYSDFVAKLAQSEEVVHIERPHHTTDDIELGGFLFRCTKGPLIEKIKREEM